MTIKVLEYDEAADGGFTVWIEDSELRGSRSWVAHHHIEDTWSLTTMEGDDAGIWLTQDAIDQRIALAKEKEERAGWNIQYQPKP